jgi:hypothetical protein
VAVLFPVSLCARTVGMDQLLLTPGILLGRSTGVAPGILLRSPASLRSGRLLLRANTLARIAHGARLDAASTSSDAG